MTTNTFTSKDISLETERKATLRATLFTPNDKKVTQAILIAPATGIKRTFYKHFARYLASHGFGVISFDNEGIGNSKQYKGAAGVKKCDASLVSWGQFDMPAVLTQLKVTFPEAKYHLIGHSAGGQLFGLMHNHGDLTSVFNVACSSGQIANMQLSHKLKAIWFMDFFIPASNLAFGYAKNNAVGMGEPLPKLVAKQWRDWCNGSGYVKMAFGKEVKEHHYDEITLPSLWINAPDDYIANDANVADMLRVFPNINATTKTLIPSDYGLKEIGHMKFFSRQSEVLWDMAVDWINEHA